MDQFALLVAATLNSGTVLAFAALGLLINERAGVVNLGAEGMMLVAAVAGFATAVHTGSDWLAFGAGALAGAVLAAAFGVLVIWLNTNQYATGLALSLFGAGFSAFVGIRYTQEKLGEQHTFHIPVLGDLPFVGPALFRQHPLVYGAIALTSPSPGSSTARVPAGAARGRRVARVGACARLPVRRIRLAALVVGGRCAASPACTSRSSTPTSGSRA
jgi:simple sugar transport system permease protein